MAINNLIFDVFHANLFLSLYKFVNNILFCSVCVPKAKYAADADPNKRRYIKHYVRGCDYRTSLLEADRDGFAFYFQFNCPCPFFIFAT